MSTTLQPSSQFVFGPFNGGGDIIHFQNSQNQVVSWIDAQGVGQGALALSASSSAGSFATYIDPIAQFGIVQDAKWVTDAVFNTASTSCGSGTVPAGTCVTLSATDPPFSCPGNVFPCTSGGDVGKQEFGTANCTGGNPGGCNKAVPKGTIVKVWDATHAQVSVAAILNSTGSMNNFAWGSAGNGAKLQTMVTFLANNPGTAVAFPC